MSLDLVELLDSFRRASETETVSEVLKHRLLQQKAQDMEITTKRVRSTPWTTTNSQVVLMFAPAASFSAICSLCLSSTCQSMLMSMGGLPPVPNSPSSRSSHVWGLFLVQRLLPLLRYW